MARHPQPRELAALKGADKHDPQRYRNDSPKAKTPLGNAPDHMAGAAKAAWFELETFALPGVLTGADRFVMEVTASLLAEFRQNPSDFAAGKYTHLIGCLARLGLTPADRQKLGADKKPEDNPFENF